MKLYYYWWIEPNRSILYLTRDLHLNVMCAVSSGSPQSISIRENSNIMEVFPEGTYICKMHLSYICLFSVR